MVMAIFKPLRILVERKADVKPSIGYADSIGEVGERMREHANAGLPLLPADHPVHCDGCNTLVDLGPNISRAIRETGGTVRCTDCGPPAD